MDSHQNSPLGIKIPPPVAETIGFEVISFRNGKAEFKMHASTRHHNPMGTVHGGIFVDIMDAAMGFAMASTLKEGEMFTTINLQINFLKAVVDEEIFASAEVIKRGQSIGFVESKLVNSAGELIATSQSTCKVLKR